MSRTWRTRVAPLALVAGAFAVSYAFAPKIPQERRVRFVFRQPASIEGFEATWSSAVSAKAPENEADALVTARWSFPRGTNPASVVETVNLPDGAYTLDVSAHRAGRLVASRKAVRLEQASEVTVHID